MEFLVIDIGGSFIKYALMDEGYHVMMTDQMPTPQDGREELTEALGGLYDKYAAKISGMALAAPGIIDSVNGYFYTGGALRYNEGFAMKEALMKRCPTKIHIENDGKCAAMAEVELGCLSGVGNGVVLVLGTMIGGGIIKDGKLYKGSHFSAGEVSFICTDGKQKPDSANIWGNRCGGVSLVRRVAEIKRLPYDAMDGKKVFMMAGDGDEETLKCLDRYTKEIAVQIFNLQNILDPERIAIGGGISGQPLLMEYIQKNLDEIYRDFAYIVRKAEVVTCQYLNASNLLGALVCFLKEEKF